MKFILARFVLLLCAGSVLSLNAAAARTERVRLNGTDYVPLLSWTRVHQFNGKWLRRDESLLFTNRSSRFQVEVDSREAWINGIHCWLLYPTMSRGGQVFIAQQDLDTTLRPILIPSPNAFGDKVKTICLDPGHGGKDPGNHVGNRQEKQYVLLLAQELRDQLKAAGFTVILTRSTDTFLELGERPDVATRKGADLFVSLHFNATENARNEAKGAEVYALTPPGASSTAAGGDFRGGGRYPGNRNDAKNMLLAYQIQKSLVGRLTVEDRGVRRARFQVLRDATMPSVLIEGGFLSHPSEGKKIFDAAYRREMARAIVQGIQAYKKVVER